jgi:hypothetical protein
MFLISLRFAEYRYPKPLLSSILKTFKIVHYRYTIEKSYVFSLMLLIDPIPFAEMKIIRFHSVILSAPLGPADAVQPVQQGAGGTIEAALWR